MKSKILDIRFLAAIPLVVVLFFIPVFTGAIVGPFFWIFKIWTGDPHQPLHEQIPVFGPSDHVGIWAAIVMGCSAIVYVGGYILRRPHYAKRVALILAGLSWYLYLVSTPWPYMVSRQIIGLSAFLCIFCARILKRYFRPIKTVLFFIGIGFTCEALAWALADPFSTIISSALFAIVAAFFTRIDENRKHKTRVCTAAGLLVFIISTGVYYEFPLWLKVITIVCGVYRLGHMIHIYGNPDGPFVTTFDSTPSGLTDICYPHIEMHKEQGSRIVYHSPELLVTDNPRTHLTMFKIASVFGDTNSVLLGFGTPNAAVSVYDDAEKVWKRLSAFMFFRQKSRISKLDELQVGLYFELRGLTPEVRTRLLCAMEKNSGFRGATCAHSTAHALADAGFSLGKGRALRRVYRPSKFASLIWRFGLMYEDNPVEVRIVNTSKLEVRDHLVGVWAKEFMSPIRLVTKVFHGKKELPDHVSAQDQPVTVRQQQMWSGVPVTVQMSRPNGLGSLLSFMWGRHAEFRVSVAGLHLRTEVFTPLEAFPGQLSWLSKAKKYFLFSPPIVILINKVKNQSFDRYDSIPVSAAVEMMSPVSSDEEKVLWNFAIIEAGDTYDFRLTPLKNQDPKSQSSKFRRISNWLLAKHVVATGYNERTVFAGEGWVVRDRMNDDVSICINNNSGTYKPTLEQLESAAELIRGMGINVETRIHVEQ